MGIQIFQDSIPWYYMDRKVGSRDPRSYQSDIRQISCTKLMTYPD